MQFLEHRISDKNFLRYIKRFLKSGIMEDGKVQKSYEGALRERLAKFKLEMAEEKSKIPILVNKPI